MLRLSRNDREPAPPRRVYLANKAAYRAAVATKHFLGR